MMMQQLKGLADDKNVYHNYVFYLLESLATVKSVVLLLDVDDTHGERERLLQQLIGLAFDLAPLPNLARAAKLYLLEIFQTLVDEADFLSNDIIKSIVQRCGDVRVETRNFAADLVRLCADKLQPGLGLFLNEAALNYSGGDNQDGKQIESLRQVHSQIIEVGRIAPTAVTSAVAQIEEELRADDVDVRLIALTCLADFFTAPGQDITRQYPSLWASWLSRMNDRAVNMRIQWSKLAVPLLGQLVFAPSNSELRSCIAEKLQDLDAKVREKTISCLRKFIEERPPTILGLEVCKEVWNRCRDKSEEVRIAAMDLQSELLHKLFKVDPKGDLFSGCVNAVFKLIYTNERSLRIFYEYFIEHSVMMPKTDAAQQAALLVAMYMVMSDEARKAFKKWLSDKSRFVKYFSAFVKIASLNSEDSRLATVAQHLSDLFMEPLEARGCLLAISGAILADEPSKKVFEQLALPETSISRLVKSVDGVMKYGWTKKDARLKGYLMIFVARRASLIAISNELITEILRIAEGELETAAKRLVEEIISEFPALGVEHTGLLEELILSNEDNADHLLAYSRFAAACPEKCLQVEISMKSYCFLWNTAREDR